MIGQDFTDKISAIVTDLQTVGKGKTVNILCRNPDNTTTILPLSSTAAGVVNAAQLSAVNAFFGVLAQTADDFAEVSGPLAIAAEAFKLASVPHQALSDAASLARKNYNDATFADPAFQTAKTALDAERINGNYVSGRDAYQNQNVSENFGNLGDAKGKYLP